MSTEVPPPPSISRVLLLLAGINFAASLFVRLADPIVPSVAADFAVDVDTAALLGTAFALPFALMQPILGPLGDLVGKTRVITACVAVLGLSAVAAALAPNFPMLLAARILAGMAGAGIFPVSIALLGDMVPMQSRQIAIARILIGSIGGLLTGAMASGILADLVGWRGVFVAAGTAMVFAFAGTAFGLRKVPVRRAERVDLVAAFANYRQVFSNPRAKVCYGAVFTEGAALFGIFPYVAYLLSLTGEPRAGIAGLVIGAFAAGGLLYSVTVGTLIKLFGQRRIMIGGGLIAGLSLVIEATLPHWPVQFATMAAMGFGFFLLHASIQVQMTELAPTARGTAVSMHSFSYFLGQALGPVLYSVGFAAVGPSATLVAGGIVMVLVGFTVARLLHGAGRKDA
ncbi:MAG: MFS transporter [Variibacter sp.]